MSKEKYHKDNYDTKSSVYTYSVGDWVWCQMGYRKEGVGLCPKLQSPYARPYLITEKFSPLNMRIQLNHKSS